MAEATVLRPALDKKDKLLSPWIQLPALGHQCSFVEWRHSIHGDVHRDALPFSGWRGGNHGDLGLLPTESRATELEGVRADEAVRASANRRFLELPAIHLQRCITRLCPTPLKTAHQRRWARADDNVDLWHCNPKSRTVCEVAMGKAGHLSLGNDRGDDTAHHARDLCNCCIGFRCWRYLAEQLLHLLLPAVRLEDRRGHGHRARLADLLLGGVRLCLLHPGPGIDRGWSQQSGRAASTANPWCAVAAATAGRRRRRLVGVPFVG
mmetsp:Transcript_57011/g.137820  ORF Transcript_57011/g.137820 Transcript_57011/m.137820 type:complete len:265 (-) Transcript_57011:366-1160(-)